MRSVPGMLCLLLMGASLLPRTAAAQRGGHTIMGVFAHPDDERIVGPLLARYAREGDHVYLVVSTDGSKGVRDYAGIPAGPTLARVRAGETRCAAEKLGIQPPIMLGLEDAGLNSFEALDRLGRELTGLVEKLKPDVIFTIGPEGGTGHPDHRLVGDVITEVVQRITDPNPPALYYASLSTERMRNAPPASPTVRTMAERYLTVRVPFSAQDLKAAQASFACHASQYNEKEREAVDRYLAYGFDGRVWLRPWNGGAAGGVRSELFPQK